MLSTDASVLIFTVLKRSRMCTSLPITISRSFVTLTSVLIVPRLTTPPELIVATVVILSSAPPLLIISISP